MGEKNGQENEGVVEVGEIHEECEGGGVIRAFSCSGAKRKRRRLQREAVSVYVSRVQRRPIGVLELS